MFDLGNVRKLLAQRPQRIACPDDGLNARHQTVMETETRTQVGDVRQRAGPRDAVTRYTLQTSES